MKWDWMRHDKITVTIQAELRQKPTQDTHGDHH